MRNFSDTAIIFCAHGDRRGASPNQHLIRLVTDVRSSLNPSFCDYALLSSEGDLVQKLALINESHLIIVPMIFSDGFFFNKIKLTLDEYSISKPNLRLELLPPICDWSEIAACLSARIDGAKTLLIAHGSKKSNASRLANERLAKRLRELGAPQIECAYLEEPPFAETTLKACVEPAIVIGLFMGDGLHGGEDWERALERTVVPPKEAFTIGMMQELSIVVRQKLCEMDG